jgi:conflict system pore-forming effector with SLATT domain
MTQENGREYILATARELYGRAIYSHKTHEKEREIWSGRACAMNVLNIILISFTTLFAIISATFRPSWSLLVTAILASATTAFVLWQSSFDPVGKESQHRTAAKELLWIREQLLLLIERCHTATEQVSHLQASLESITRELTGLYKFAPNTSPTAYAKAGAALKNGEFTFSDAEIDAFLPGKLRRTRPEK